MLCPVVSCRLDLPLFMLFRPDIVSLRCYNMFAEELADSLLFVEL